MINPSFDLQTLNHLCSKCILILALLKVFLSGIINHYRKQSRKMSYKLNAVQILKNTSYTGIPT